MDNLEKPIPEPKFMPYQFPAYITAALYMSSHQVNKQDEHWTDCFFYSEEQDMQAHIPCCNYRNKYYDRFDCNECHAYVTNETVHTLIKSMVDNGEFDRLEENNV